MKRVSITLAAALLAGIPALAGECFAPVPPVPEHYHGPDRGDLLRRDYRHYFRDVETCLNCVNRRAAVVRDEARQATRAFNRVLDDTRPSGDADRSGFFGHAGPLTERGTLFLDHPPKRLDEP